MHPQLTPHQADHAATGVDRHITLEAREVDWEIRPGHTMRGYGFNGQVPGPAIEAGVGDTLVVHFTNNLPEPTSIHWHGLRVPADMDGSDHMRHLISPGGTFEYRFVLPDAGTFWYHPHVREPVQLERGLYGAVIVRGSDEPLLDHEHLLILDDVRLDRAGQVARPGRLIEPMKGREGSIRLVNGTNQPHLTIAAGQVERWRIINAASARYVRLSIGGREFRILGTDGGLVSDPITSSDVLLAPGERVDLAVGPFSEGETLSIDSLPYRRGAGKRGVEPFGTLQVGPAAPSQAHIPARLRRIEPVTSPDAATTRTIRLGGRLSLRRGVQGLINDQPYYQDDPVRVGELQVWEIVNETAMDHPFHLHGFFFQILDRDGTPAVPNSWKDTVNVPAKSRLRIAWFPDDRPGNWMYHCHILEHHAAGMMAHFAITR